MSTPTASQMSRAQQETLRAEAIAQWEPEFARTLFEATEVLTITAENPSPSTTYLQYASKVEEWLQQSLTSWEVRP